MKRILVPTDFSSNANKALDYAVCLSKKAGAELILLHACELIHNPFKDKKQSIEEHNQLVQNKALEQLSILKQSIVETEQLQLMTELYDGGVIESIMEAAETSRADLIVMGTLGRTGITSKILGSKTAALLSQSRVPVLAVPFAYEWEEPKRILLALNTPKEDISLLKPAFEIAALFQADVRTAIFSDVHEEAVEIMVHSQNSYSIQAKLQKKYPNTFVKAVHLSGTDFYNVVQEYITANDINLLVMITHKRSVTQQVFHRSMTRAMNYHTTIPLLSIHA
jgi:nucleotide-binding universal stress UspA family protein